MDYFKLTKSQKVIAEKELAKAEKAYHAKKRGIIVAQVEQHYVSDSDVWCCFKFVPKRQAIEIQNILKKDVENKAGLVN